MPGDDVFHTRSTDWVAAVAASEAPGNRWNKVNLHVHARGKDPAEIVDQARKASLDLIAVTDHQTFDAFSGVARAAERPGRLLVVLPGIELTSLEGTHLLAAFPPDYSSSRQTALLGWLELDGSGNTSVASRRNVKEILSKVDEEGGIVITPHPFTAKIGLLDSARKLSTKMEWLETDLIRLIQVTDEKVRYIGHDENGDWINRYVLDSASQKDVKESTYCLAPFNQTDCYDPALLDVGCSWFRMEQPSVEGLKQVACEPRTRISRTPPRDPPADSLVAIRVAGGYCGGQVFRFNAGLNCIIGPNYSGKSAVLDFIRFGLEHDHHAAEGPQKELLRRLGAILQADGVVELIVRSDASLYLIRREFTPVFVEGGRLGPEVAACESRAVAYRLETSTGRLAPVDDFSFPVEVYEQGRISRLRADVDRQLGMLDEFAGTGVMRAERDTIIAALNKSATTLAPLYEEREQLKSDVEGLAALEQELAEKEKHLPGEEAQKWAAATTFVSVVEDMADALGPLTASLSTLDLLDQQGEMRRLFGNQIPSFDASKVAEADLLGRLAAPLRTALQATEQARQDLVGVGADLGTALAPVRDEWKMKKAARDKEVSDQLALVGVESPKQIIARVEALRASIDQLKRVKQPRLVDLEQRIQRAEIAREELLSSLRVLTKSLGEMRRGKAEQLTLELEGALKIGLEPGGDRRAYRALLDDLCDQITTRDQHIKSREGQLDRVAERMTPLDLAEALRQGGNLHGSDGEEIRLHEHCGITENTEKVLSRIVDDISLRNLLETVEVPDTLQILVRRQGETTYGDLTTGLSPGEQSAALLSLALHARSMPLILDQPEDELGYRFVVHRIIPKVLQAKFARQLLVVTHNANVPVLGDADYILRMENRPRSTSGRECVVAVEGGFESNDVTHALLELEGGEEAFKFRQHRYGLRR